ncbi:SRCR domain and Parallel beta-helix repeat and Pectin lyase fold/virulence factor domain and Pectin lyase fold domain and C-type lectin-like domain and C-type lectin fold domain and SRCR-like domain-containing protein [Strongyloides ratti]|uniref:SRCR domain-containing protein n=1 Tax=Strongyloides ratti TaxID=34506 RepID=A0A090MVW2_STRRB|nr:SRCR domain and Parallel beta-helix repeat and Pectin lyase fold/virulence factor domain and Pectin lyase fold domain and C-type lectin-like domain and C-type lectin fold domain and SRCR-like domain-containing protein [Strongyloides ratti]CEF63163.1 SRCR domain and Parallel beta-helix repeat and Pectin lyase fold/virulence factor domain and Pectin lyase fold domain and C-type lectin-like domain and C-type lectin fold domain and SRCR-like domain-containing protein [Strongyloides ratti]
MYFINLTISLLQYLLYFFAFTPHLIESQGQFILPPGSSQPIQPIKNTIGGVYSKNVTLYFMNSPYRVNQDLIVEHGVTLHIQTGVIMYFDSGVGMKVFGIIEALGNEHAHIQMLPYQQQLIYDHKFPDFRLIDGPSVRQGRLQIKVIDKLTQIPRWKSVCTALTNWTSIDTTVACNSLGYSGGGFWKWYLRNNDTYPIVISKPNCHYGASNLYECEGLKDVNKIPMSENICQGEDDIGLYCWGKPIFRGWEKHWKGIQIINSPFTFVNEDPDEVSLIRKSYSRLDYVDIMYAGYDLQTKNVTPAVYVEGTPPLFNGMKVSKSARDGFFFYESSGPIFITNSTIEYNRGHGIAVDNTTDGRLFVNSTIIQNNYGDGIWYKQKRGGIQLIQKLNNNRFKRQISFFEEENDRIDMCKTHILPSNQFFPHLIRLHLQNGTFYNIDDPPLCWMSLSLPSRLSYTYTIQFIDIINRNNDDIESKTNLIICDGNENENLCRNERYNIPIYNGIFPQSISLKSHSQPIYIALLHKTSPLYNGKVVGDIEIRFKIHASVLDKGIYGLNVTNSLIFNNTGCGIRAMEIRDRTCLSNVTINNNEGLAGFLIKDGSADVWVNGSSIDNNWGDGMNISYAGGSINFNGSTLIGNRWRGFAFHQNDSLPFLPLRQEIIFKGRPSNNRFYLRTILAHNLWGGMLIGNYCTPFGMNFEPKVFINWVEFVSNIYHPHIEVFSCQRIWPPTGQTLLDISGNRIERGTGIGFRMEPAVNVLATISSNIFLEINNTALLIRNSKHPQLSILPAKVNISKNAFKFNRGQYIVNIGLNEEAENQKMFFNQQNEVNENKVINPFPYLKPRSTPYAALVVSSSNVIIQRNCFRNPEADYEIGTELSEHAKWIDAKENNWGSPQREIFMPKIFDQFYRYSLASIEVNPYAATCNQLNPKITYLQEYFRQFKKESHPFILGGKIYENHDLVKGRYVVTDDLHIVPGAKLTLSPGTVIEFSDNTGMLVEGELLRTDMIESKEPIIFTGKKFNQQKVKNVRLMDENDNEDTYEGRLEVFIDGNWGSVCNRSFTAFHGQLVCNQLGLIIDPEFFENWRIYPPPGELPMIMDNIRCEENEYDITKCRHDGVNHNIEASCPPTSVIGLRCLEPHWAGVRYSLLANPPIFTGQPTMNNWIIEKAGLFDFRSNIFKAALQIDWNYHTFENLVIKNSFYHGLDIIYNDLTKKPAFRDSYFINNRRDGINIRSGGITIERVFINNNGNAGIQYNPMVHEGTQKDIVSWLDKKEQPEMEANNVFIVPNGINQTITVFESQLNQRKFLVFKENNFCPIDLNNPCLWEIDIEAIGSEFGMNGKLAIQLVNRAGNETDEEAILTDYSTSQSWSVRKNTIEFPIVSRGNRMSLKYSRSYGKPKLILLVLFLDTQEYLDRFVHVYKSEIKGNQYAVLSIHYSNLTYDDGTILIRRSQEMLWFQKVNFTKNTEAVLWINNPQHVVLPGTEIAEITYNIDNCSITENYGSIIDTHRDQFSSANIFHWIFWSNTFEKNKNSGIFVHLPDNYNLLETKNHSFLMTENRFINNTNFHVHLRGFYAFLNISSNNITDNICDNKFGILEISGTEKYMIIERNRFLQNHGKWMIKVDIESHTLRDRGSEIEGFIQYNYFLYNTFVNNLDDYVETLPRSYAIGIFGLQKIDVHFNRLRNLLMDFELVAGVKSKFPADDVLNVTHNWWGTGNDATIFQRIFDLDDCTNYILAGFSPFYVTEELFLDYWWRPHIGQLAEANYIEPDVLDLKGRMYISKNMTLLSERWYKFPFFYKPEIPYRISKDLIIMPNATLYIEKGVEIHVSPNVNILVLGELICGGTYWEPCRIKPLNETEFIQTQKQKPTRYKREVYNNLYATEIEYLKRNRRKVSIDPIFDKFPILRRQDPYYQTFEISLERNGSAPNAGFLQIYNETTGEIVPSCDRQFTLKNARVVCKQLGLPYLNAYHWITPRWDYNPKIRLVRTYMEPRECFGDEDRLDKCLLRMSGNDSQWMCMDNEHFNYIHCGSDVSLNKDYVGNWGSLIFGPSTLELGIKTQEEKSILRHIEIVGGGRSHNESLDVGALQIVRRSPVIDALNVTNSSMHGIQIISPSSTVILNMINVTNNKGQGINILATNLQTPMSTSFVPTGPLTIPYYSPGLLDICSTGKIINVQNRIILFYKYDSINVDCIKVFHSLRGPISFRFIHFNLYKSKTNLGRSDALYIYSDASFKQRSLLKKYSADNFDSKSLPIQSSTGVISLHLRGTAADGEYGFIAEIAIVPNNPDTANAMEINIRYGKLYENDRGAIEYRNIGEIGPSLTIENCAIDNNGYYLFGNISTSSQAVEVHLHNTLSFNFRRNSVTHNRGGLLLTDECSSAVARLTALIKNNAFVSNKNSTTLAFLGNNYQSVMIVGNIITLNEALYFDTALVQKMSANFSANVFSNNTGTHIVNTQGYSKINSDTQLFYFNSFQDNIALGSGHQYEERYGYLSYGEIDEFSRRPKRQVLTQRGVSFDWWTHVDFDTARYRGTILAGSSQQRFYHNVFNNPLNDYELVTSNASQYMIGRIDARENYWGYPGTSGVASGKIRDYNDYHYLISVDYEPVLESNTSLIDGDCPAGWFIAGNNEFKSCFLFIGAVMTYNNAVNFCAEIGGFMPYLRTDDIRQMILANKIDSIVNSEITEPEKKNLLPGHQEVSIWISGVSVPSIQCGKMSSRSGRIGIENCNYLLPFVCEKGTKPYQEPIMWRKGLTYFVIILGCLIGVLVMLSVCWYFKSKKRDEEHIMRKDFARESVKRKQEEKLRWEQLKQRNMLENQKQLQKKGHEVDSISKAHMNLVDGNAAYTASSSRTTTYLTNSSSATTPSTIRTGVDTLSTDDYTACTSVTNSYGVPSSNISNSRVHANPNPYAEIETFTRKNSKTPIILSGKQDFLSECSTCDGTESSTYSSVKGSSVTDETSNCCSEVREGTNSDISSTQTLIPNTKPSFITFGKSNLPNSRPKSTFIPKTSATTYLSSSKPQLISATSNPSILNSLKSETNSSYNNFGNQQSPQPKFIQTPMVSELRSFSNYQPLRQSGRLPFNQPDTPSKSLNNLTENVNTQVSDYNISKYIPTDKKKSLETSM